MEPGKTVLIAEQISRQEPFKFLDWMRREMPPGTVIGNPDWWACRIAKQFVRQQPCTRCVEKAVQIAEIRAEFTAFHNTAHDRFSMQEERMKEQAAEIERLTKERDEACEEARRQTRHVETVVKERDTEIARSRPLHALIKSLEEQKSHLSRQRDEWKEAINTLESERAANAVLTEQLAALAETAQKMREALAMLFEKYENGCLCYDKPEDGNFLGYAIHLSDDQFKHCVDLLTQLDQSANVLNRIKAAGMLEAAELMEQQHNWITNAAASMLIRARAAELEGK